jgi:glycosyltransferase involved in cell wall biosynthesis
MKADPDPMPSASDQVRFSNLTPHVAILLATKNGAPYLGDQLTSYVQQTFGEWSLYVSDDGSTDNTIDIIQRFAASHDRVKSIRQGPQQGFVRNFLSLAQDKSILGDYFAFSDQDDIWYSDKIERALGFLKNVPTSVPALYFSRTEVVDANLKHLGFSPLFTKQPAFQNALIQNIGGGNTMVFNSAAKRLLELGVHGDVAAHDWWAYQIVTAVGGTAIYDERPSMKYRQHPGNVLGSNQGARAGLRRIFLLFESKFQHWNDINISALRRLSVDFKPASQTTLDRFVDARNARFLAMRLLRLHQSGVYRQTFLSNLALIAACALRKI